VLAADQARPVLDYKSLEDIVQESEFAAGKNTKQVPIEISKNIAEVERGRISRLGHHLTQYFTQGLGPIPQQCDCTAADLGRSGEIRSTKVPLLPSESAPFLHGAEEEN